MHKFHSRYILLFKADFLTLHNCIFIRLHILLLYPALHLLIFSNILFFLLLFFPDRITVAWHCHSEGGADGTPRKASVSCSSALDCRANAYT